MSKVIEYVTTVVAVVGVLIATSFALAWPVMIALGIWHSYFSQVPTLGFFATVVSLFALGTVVKAGMSVQKDNA